jgi:hypothetical protein
MNRARILGTAFFLIIGGMLPLMAQSNTSGVVPRLVNYSGNSGRVIEAQGKNVYRPGRQTAQRFTIRASPY